MAQPEPPPPKRKTKTKPLTWILLGVIIVAGLPICIGYYQASTRSAATRTDPAGSAPESRPTSQTETREEQLLQKFEGNGNEGTRPFTAPERWELRWVMTGVQNNIIVLKEADGGTVDLPENSVGPSDGRKFYPKGGSYFLEITARGKWTIEVWQLP